MVEELVRIRATYGKKSESGESYDTPQIDILDCMGIMTSILIPPPLFFIQYHQKNNQQKNQLSTAKIGTKKELTRWYPKTWGTGYQNTSHRNLIEIGLYGNLIEIRSLIFFHYYGVTIILKKERKY